VLLLVLSLLGFARNPNRQGRTPGPTGSRWLSGRRPALLMGGLAIGLLVLVVTGWIVLALALGGLVALWDRFFGGAAEERAAVTKLEALAAWTESLRDTIAGAVGLEQAIPATAATAAPQIRPALNLLVDRLRIREPLPDALRRLADDLDDASADLIVAALLLNSRLRGPGLREVLTALAVSAREELDMRRRIDAERRSTRRSVQMVVGITVGVAAMLVLLNRQYVAPYGSFVGQVVLTVVIALFAAGVAWLRRLARVQNAERFLLVRAVHTERPVAS